MLEIRKLTDEDKGRKVRFTEDTSRGIQIGTLINWRSGKGDFKVGSSDYLIVQKAGGVEALISAMGADFVDVE